MEYTSRSSDDEEIVNRGDYVEFYEDYDQNIKKLLSTKFRPIGKFENPNKLPIEELKLTAFIYDEYTEIPALDERWTTEKMFIIYQAPTLLDDQGNVNEESKYLWKETMVHMNNDFIWLLKLQFHLFWSNILHNTSIIDSAVSFLANTWVQYKDEDFLDDDSLKNIFFQLRENVVKIFQRVITDVENAFEYMNQPFHGHLIYDHFIFTIPIALDLCREYASDNKDLVRKIIETAVNFEPAYNYDIYKTVQFLQERFEIIEREVKDPKPQIGVYIGTLYAKKNDDELNMEKLKNRILDLFDAIPLMNLFLNIYPEAIILFNTDEFIERLLHLYENTIPKLYQKLIEFKHDPDSSGEFDNFYKYLFIIREKIVHLYRSLTFKKIENIMQDDSSKFQLHEKYKALHEFLDNIFLALSKKQFIEDYNKLYPFEDDYYIFLMYFPKLNIPKCKKILFSIQNIVMEKQIKTEKLYELQCETVKTEAIIQNLDEIKISNEVNAEQDANREISTIRKIEFNDLTFENSKITSNKSIAHHNCSDDDFDEEIYSSPEFDFDYYPIVDSCFKFNRKYINEPVPYTNHLKIENRMRFQNPLNGLMKTVCVKNSYDQRTKQDFNHHCEPASDERKKIVQNQCQQKSLIFRRKSFQNENGFYTKSNVMNNKEVISKSNDLIITKSRIYKPKRVLQI